MERSLTSWTADWASTSPVQDVQPASRHAKGNQHSTRDDCSNKDVSARGPHKCESPSEGDRLPQRLTVLECGRGCRGEVGGLLGRRLTRDGDGKRSSTPCSSAVQATDRAQEQQHAGHQTTNTQRSATGTGELCVQERTRRSLEGKNGLWPEWRTGCLWS